MQAQATLLERPQVAPRGADRPVMNLNAVSSTALSGMGSAVQRLQSAAGRIAASAAVEPADFGQTLASDMVAQRVALYDFKASMRTFQAADEMMGTLLDIRA